ncbi:hypothetical protein Emtol_1555 [Emticicia oligotrophica DSM 17448]|uniref:DUF481 domain-containing protein n=1 Tax=Emticicia oligotrophica (strain DSM 17448 / CIP 109782 / MTCC 6937 / GPTSA100-15) TaxID=929562 RepID=A0ABM5N064_EMTOG|nr:DUF481 domain-containing protein [Emticicia oligotrophica]AFK02701.1 hypothetical protein Emtol_1555 [Emticicia oligotrophica DSM 17448]
MKLKLLTCLLLFFYFNTKAQDAPADTLQPIKSDSVMPADSTSEEEEEGEDEEGEEEEEEQDSTPAKFRYRIGADGTYTSGNVNRALIQFVSNFDLNSNKIIKFSSSPSYIYGQQNKVLAEKEVFLDLRTSILHERKFYYLAFTSFEKSNLRKINNRFIGAGGVGLKLIQKDHAYVSVTNVLLYEKTDFVINEKFPDRNLWRNSTRLFGEYTFKGSKASISHTLFIQPGITEKNFRWNGNLILKYQLSKHVSFRSTVENSYESIVVPGRQNNDFRWTFGVVYEGKK